MQTKNLTMGILAHVDAGKTTLSESILYTCGTIRNLGRVDHKDAFLDNFALERARGITIFSKQARITLGGVDMTLLDTPGHVDFSAEMERTLQVLDYAILVISGADGVQGHVQTLWKLLKRYEIPTFLFVNKMDQEGTDAEQLLVELQSRLDEKCIRFGEMEGTEDFYDELAMCGEELMEEYLEQGAIQQDTIAYAIATRQVFPCYFGSALKIQGVEELLTGIQKYSLFPEYALEFGARVYKITRDSQGNRLTHLKITGGTLRVKQVVSNQASASPENVWEEKVDQIRIYNGANYQTTDEVTAGGICTVTGLTKTFVGEGLGCEDENALPMLEPVLTYQILLPEGSDPIKVLGQLRQIEEEEPQLHIVWKESLREIHAQVMGEVQIEILKATIVERFDLEVEFGSGSIVYKETIAEVNEGIGHFEPLRHYAEVHLLLEPGERGSGMQFATVCSEDVLDRNWQRLIMTHLEEKAHVGVLTGSEITDMRITLIAGKAHLKHTEGGDFRQSTYRAIRQGLRKSKNILLEPVFAFQLEVPTQMLGRAMSDIQRMYGKFETPITEGEVSILTGTAPVATMQDYQREVNAYTRGHGRLSCTLKGYEPCHNAEEVIEKIGYDADGDLENPTGSVFCAHGAGFVVNWDEVDSYAHVESGLDKEAFYQKQINAENGVDGLDSDDIDAQAIHVSMSAQAARQAARKENNNYISQEEIDNIFNQTYGSKQKEDKNRYRLYRRRQENLKRNYTSATEGGKEYVYKPKDAQKEYLLVDGYNIIFAWEDLRELAAVNIDSARDKLMDELCNYQGYLGNTLILVFDAYKVKGNPGSVMKYHNIYVVYTKEAETADQYIEKTVHEIGKKYSVTVATSDALEQMIIWGSGATRLSARGLREAMEQTKYNGSWTF